MSVPLIIAVTSTTVIVLILLSSTVTYVYMWKRRLAKTQGNLIYESLGKKRSSSQYIKGNSSVFSCDSNIQFICLTSEIRGYVQKNSAINLYDSERYVKDLIESGGLKEDDGQAIDIPHFHLESILGATNNFSNANKLGQGGFGPVYKVIKIFLDDF